MKSQLPENWKPPKEFIATEVIKTDLELWKPKEYITTIDWFEKNIKVPERTSDFAGPYNRKNFPYQIGVLEAFDDLEVKEISLQWATQTGKSLLIQSLVAKIADTDPSPMMFVCPDSATAKEVSSERIMPTAESVPSIRIKLLPEARRNDLKPDFGDCMVYMGWSGSPTSLGQKAVRYVFGTEIDKWSTHKSREADPADLVRERVKAFWNHKLIFEGTPTIEGQSRIDQLGKEANQLLKYHIPCPHCGTKQVLDFKRIKFQKGKKDKLDRDLAETTSYYQCIKCKKKIEDHHKLDMLRRGVWAEEKTRIPKNFKGHIFWTPDKPKTRIHFHLSSLYSPVLEFGDVAGEFVRCKKGEGRRTLQNFVNSWLAETWNINIREYKWKELKKVISVKETKGTIPEWVYFLTAGIDVQKGWACYIIRGWGYRGRSRLIDWGQVTTYTDLDNKILKKSFFQEGGQALNVLLAGIDSGYQPAEVYEWTNSMNHIYGERVRAIKGQSKGAPYYMTQIDRSGADGKVIEGGIQLWNLWDHHWKSFVSGKYETPAGREGAWEIPSDADEMYMRSITSEVLQKNAHPRTGAIRYEWVVSDTIIGNHYFDCEKIAAAMADMVDWRDLPEKRPEKKQYIPTISKDQESGLLIGSEDFLD